VGGCALVALKREVRIVGGVAEVKECVGAAWD